MELFKEREDNIEAKFIDTWVKTSDVKEQSEVAKQDKRVNPLWNQKWIEENINAQPCSELYPQVSKLMIDVMVGWLQKFDHEIIQRMFRRRRIFKEFNEISPCCS